MIHISMAPPSGGWRWTCFRRPAMLLAMAVTLHTVPTTATLTANTSLPDALVPLDWSQWNKTAAFPWERPDVIDTHFSQRHQQQQLRRLVHECSTQLGVPGLRCEDDRVGKDGYQVPLFYSKPFCGFEVAPTAEVLEDLAQKYTFHFIGDSTTRRLAESFVSIFSGEGSPHPMAHERTDFSSKNLKVIFDWAPLCSGPASAGEVLKTTMGEEEEEKGVNISGSRGNRSIDRNPSSSRTGGIGRKSKRTVIITAFGIHDASYQLQLSQKQMKDWYRKLLPHDVLKRDGVYAAALAACRTNTMRVVDAAVGGREKLGAGTTPTTPAEGEQLQPQGPGRARRMQASESLGEDIRHLEAAAVVPPPPSAGIAKSSHVHDDGSIQEVGATDEEPRPLVFLLQNNGYFNDRDDFQQNFLDKVHRMQREEIGMEQVENTSETKSGYEANSDDQNVGNVGGREDDAEIGKGVYLVDSSLSLYKRLSCYQTGSSSHYYEPVKLMEGKMLWDLFALVDREESRLS